MQRWLIKSKQKRRVVKEIAITCITMVNIFKQRTHEKSRCDSHRWMHTLRDNKVIFRWRNVLTQSET